MLEDLLQLKIVKTSPITGIFKVMLTLAEIKSQRSCEMHFDNQQTLYIISTKLRSVRFHVSACHNERHLFTA